jgi:hypothetical protein
MKMTSRYRGVAPGCQPNLPRTLYCGLLQRICEQVAENTDTKSKARWTGLASVKTNALTNGPRTFKQPFRAGAAIRENSPAEHSITTSKISP